MDATDINATLFQMLQEMQADRKAAEERALKSEERAQRLDQLATADEERHHRNLQELAELLLLPSDRSATYPSSMQEHPFPETSEAVTQL